MWVVWIAEERVHVDFIDPLGRFGKIEHDGPVKAAAVELQQKVGVLL